MAVMRWLWIVPALALFGLAALFGHTPVVVAIGVIGGRVCMGLGGYSHFTGT
jgi:hypothetical protein